MGMAMRGMLKVLALAAALAPVAAAAQTIDPFVGKFAGGSTQISGQDQAKRDLAVEVSRSPDGKGFLVAW